MDVTEAFEFERCGRGIPELYSTFDGLGDRIELALEGGLDDVVVVAT